MDNQNTAVAKIARLTEVVGGSMMVGAVFPTSSFKIPAHALPFFVLPLLAGALVGAGVATGNHQPVGRRALLVLFPLASVGLAAAFPAILWKEDAPYTALGIFVYAPIVFLLCRVKALRAFRLERSDWPDRGGVTVFLAWLISLLAMNGIFTASHWALTFPKDMAETGALVVFLHYTVGLIAISVPVITRSGEPPRSRISKTDMIAFPVCILVLGLTVAYRVYRPDLNGIRGLESTTSLNFGSQSQLRFFEVKNLIEQYAFWKIDTPERTVEPALVKAGYVRLKNEEIGYLERYVRGDASFDDRTKWSYYGGGQVAANTKLTKESHYVLLSGDGLHSAHLVLLWAK